MTRADRSSTSQTPSRVGGLEKKGTVYAHNFTTRLWVLGVRELMVVSGTPDEQMRAVADTQRGRVSRKQLIALGMTPRMVRTRVTRGYLHPVHRGVYAVGHSAPLEFEDEAAALLAHGEDAALTHRSAVWLWGFIRSAPDVVDVSLLHGRTGHSRSGIRLHRSLTLTDKDVVICQGLPVTAPVRALLEFADVAAPRELERAVDEALTLKRVSQARLQEQASRSGAGRAGAAAFDEVVASRRPSSITRSVAEDRFRDMILSAGIPVPEMQAQLHGFSVDFYWPAAAYVAEFDGYTFHSTRSAWRRDRAKDKILGRHGVLVDRFTWEEITGRPLEVVAHIATHVTARTLRRAAG